MYFVSILQSARHTIITIPSPLQLPSTPHITASQHHITPHTTAHHHTPPCRAEQQLQAAVVAADIQLQAPLLERGVKCTITYRALQPPQPPQPPPPHHPPPHCIVYPITYYYAPCMNKFGKNAGSNPWIPFIHS